MQPHCRHDKEQLDTYGAEGEYSTQSNTVQVNKLETIVRHKRNDVYLKCTNLNAG